MKKEYKQIGYKPKPKSESATVVEIMNGNRGYAVNPEVGVVTFNVQGLADREDLLFAESKSMYSANISDRGCLDLGGFKV